MKRHLHVRHLFRLMLLSLIVELDFRKWCAFSFFVRSDVWYLLHLGDFLTLGADDFQPAVGVPADWGGGTNDHLGRLTLVFEDLLCDFCCYVSVTKQFTGCMRLLLVDDGGEWASSSSLQVKLFRYFFHFDALRALVVRYEPILHDYNSPIPIVKMSLHDSFLRTSCGPLGCVRFGCNS